MLHLLQRCSCVGRFAQPKRCPHKVCALFFTRLSLLNTRLCTFCRQPNQLAPPGPNKVFSIMQVRVQRPRSSLFLSLIRCPYSLLSKFDQPMHSSIFSDLVIVFFQLSFARYGRHPRQLHLAVSVQKQCLKRRLHSDPPGGHHPIGT